MQSAFNEKEMLLYKIQGGKMIIDQFALMTKANVEVQNMIWLLMLKGPLDVV